MPNLISTTGVTMSARRADPDDLDASIAVRTASTPEFPALLRAAERRRKLFSDMAGIRKARKTPQKIVGQLAGTSQAAIARLEQGDADCRFSTAERYAAALGYEIEYRLVPAGDSDAARPAAEHARSSEG